MTAALAWRFVSAPTLLLVMASLAIVVANGARMSGAAGETLVQGDVTCDGTATSVDSLQILRSVAGLGTSAECLADAGDVNCDEAIDSVDSLRILRYVAGLSNASPDGCVAIGEPLAPPPTGEPIAVTLSDFGGVSEEIGYDGGTLTTTGLDGTTFTLEIPEGALAAAELISMTPVESIDSLPIEGGLVAAVDVRPSGLLLWKVAVLTIDPPVDVPTEDQTAFVISQGEFVQHPFVLDSAEMQLPLTHFSTAGVGAGEVGSVPPPTLGGDAYAAEVAPIVTAEREARLGGGPGDPNFEEEMAAIIGAYLDELVASLQAPVGASAVVAGPPDCLVAAQIVPQALGYGSQAQAIGGSSAHLQQVFQALQQISSSLGLCREAAFDRCVDEREPNMIAVIVAYTRVMQALGIDSSPSPLDEMVEKCGRFELLFEGEFCVDKTSQDCKGGIHYDFIVGAGFYFSMSVSPGPGPLGTAPLEMVLGVWGPYGGCEGETTSPGSTFQVLSGGVSMNLFRAVDPLAFPEFTLVVNPGIPPETLKLTCSFGNDTQYTTLWWQKWCSWHQPELTPPFADTAALCFYNDEPAGWGFAITDWDKNWNYYGNRSAIKEYDRDYMQVGVREIGWEKSDLTLIHEPIR